MITDITVVLKSGEDKIYKNIYDLNIYARTITFKVHWNSESGKTFKDKSFTFKDFAGYGIATRENDKINK